MMPAEAKHDDAETGRLLAGAAKVVERVPYCWLVTAAEDGGASMRPMGRLMQEAGEEEWKIRFVTDGRSRKASELRRASRVTLIFQHGPSDAYLTLVGRATLREEASEIQRRWKAGYDAYFPTELDRANAAFVEVDVERMELWIRGVTPEPFGLVPTTLERNSGCGWRVTSRRS